MMYYLYFTIYFYIMQILLNCIGYLDYKYIIIKYILGTDSG